MTFQVLVADDEPLARAMVAHLCRADAEVAHVVECGNAAEVRGGLARHPVDIAFLDIQMPEVTGLDIAEELGPGGPVVVFVTAFSHYAPDAFDVQAIDYVMKPFTDDRFREALERAKRRVRERRLGQLATQMARLTGEHQATLNASAPAPTAVATADGPKRLLVKDGDRSIVVNEKDIRWVEAEDYYVLIHTTQGRHMVRTSMAAMEQRLPPPAFIRVHRGALVNADVIKEVRDAGTMLVLADGTPIPISRARRLQVGEALRDRFVPPVRGGGLR